MVEVLARCSATDKAAMVQGGSPSRWPDEALDFRTFWPYCG